MKVPYLHTISILAAGVLALASSRATAAEPAATSVVQKQNLFQKDNLAAWCIVPFDKAKRGPEERASMLERIGVKKFVYDYRAEHIPQWDEEMEALKRHGIELTGWWFPGSLNSDAQKALELFKKHGVKPQLWVSGGGGSLSADSPEEQEKRVSADVRRIRVIAQAAAEQNLKVALYNHGSWFGEPENQIAIIERLKTEGINNVGIVYNQHHGHGHIERFPELLQKMLPYLIYLNLNGMDIQGDTKGRKIMPIAAGTEDLQLLRVIRDSGYHGPIGILNHTGEDAEARLKDNLNGLFWLSAQLEGKAAGPKPEYLSWKAPAPAPQ